VFGFYARAWPEPFEPASGVLGVANPVLALFHRRQPILRSASLWLGGAFAALAASLAAVSLFASFEWSFVAVTSIWSLTGLGILATGLQRDSLELRRGGGAWLIVVSFAVVAHVGALEAAPRSWSLLVLALVLFGAGLACQLLDRRDAPSTADAAASASAVALVVGAVAAAGLLSGQPLACAWAAEAVALVWMSHRVRARHLHALAALPFGLAVVHLLAIDAPPRQLVLPVQHPAAGAATAVAIALSAFAAAALSRGWPARGVRTYGRLERPVAALVGDQRDARDVVLWWGGAVGLYALSLAILAAWPGFDWAWVALTGVWSGVALALLLRGLRVGSAQLRHGGLATLTLVTLGVVAEGASVLDATPRSAAFLVLAVSLLVAGLAYALRVGRAPLEPVTVVATLVSLGLSWDAIRTLLEAPARGLAMLALAGLYGAIGAVLLRRPGARDLSTLYWALGLLVGAVAIEELLHGTFTVVGWSVTGVVVAWLSLRVQEPRLLVGGAATVVLALIHALVLEAPPTDLFSVQPQPGAGAPAVLVVAAAVAALAYCAEGQPGALRRGGKPSWWLAGTLVVYGTSLSIVQLAESVSRAGLEAGFQSGQTAVSAFWGLLGLGLLYAGLTRWRSLRLAGLALFAVSLGKIFLYDLPALSSIERALSFLAVGAVLLLGAFFYQRLNAGKRSDAGRDGGRTA
jgi:uncharacterized membrane protein